MFDWILDLVRTLGYPGIALLTLIENVVPPIPSELIMPFAGFLANRGELRASLALGRPGRGRDRYGDAVVVYTTLGTAAWTAALTYAVVLLGRNYDAVEDVVGVATWIVVGGIVAWYVYRVARCDSVGDEDAVRA